MTPPLIGIRRSLIGRRVSPENRLNLRGTALQVGETVRFSSIGLNTGAPAADVDCAGESKRGPAESLPALLAGSHSPKALEPNFVVRLAFGDEEQRLHLSV
jgi:hypothetical protein